MRKKSKLGIVVIIIAIICVNVFTSMNIAKACYPWERDIFTGECPEYPPPYLDGEKDSENYGCYAPEGRYFEAEFILVALAHDCQWAVWGSCTPTHCPYGSFS